MRLLYIFLLAIISCSVKKADIVDRANKIELSFFNNGDTLRKVTTSSPLIKDFNKVLKGDVYPVKCRPTGSAVFYIDDSIIYAVYFSIDGTGGDDKCQYLILEDKCWKLSYNVGMYLDETFYELKKVNEQNN